MLRTSKAARKREKQSNASTRTERASEKQLLNYALAAGTASAALFGGPGIAEAEVVYTPANISVTSPHGLVIDLNHDGTNDFFLGFKGASYVSSLRVNGLNSGNQVAELNSSPVALPRGIEIGPEWKFGKSAAMAVDSYGYLRGAWAYITHHCLGLKFNVNGQDYYGWAEFSVVRSGVLIKATLEGYAYNNVPGQAILTGQTSGNLATSRFDRAPAIGAARPATLGLLALGSLGLDLWRRKNPSAARGE
jgi:hypothetical protein